MRSLSLLALVLFISCSAVLSDTCNKPAACPANPAQVPFPFYQLNFSTPSATAVTYGYNATDNDGCGHTGLAVTGIGGGGSAGVATGYIDLVNVTSAQGAAATPLPTIGSSTVGGSLAANTMGWTFEATFKPLAQTTWAKVFCLGNGAGPNDIILGWNNGMLEVDFTVNSVTGNNNPRTGTNSGNVPLIPNPNVVLNTWYHLVQVVQQVDTTGVVGNWFSYVNGQLLNGSATSQFYIPDGVRPFSYLGRSCYSGDQLFQMEIDTFRIYNQALNADQVTSLYAQQMGQCNITMSSTPVLTNAFPLLTPPNSTTIPSVAFGLGFVTNPQTAVGAGVTPAYGWELYDQGDVSCGLNATHYGLLVLSGGPDAGDSFSDPSWVNLTTTSGPNSIGNATFPQIGGGQFTAGNVSTGTAGLSFEVTFKPALQETWAKLFDIGSFRVNYTLSGTCNNDLVFGWVSNSLQFMNFEVCDPNGNGLSMGEFGPFLAGYWYHVVISLQLLPNGQSNWYAYLNGQLLSVSSNVQYPVNAVRQWANLGKSNWNDELWSGYIDSFNLYNVALSPQQVANMSAIALGPLGASACAFTTSNTSVIPATALYYDLSFTTNPAVTNQAYGWLAYDPTDSAAAQQVHRGLVNLTGCVSGSCNGTYINMSAPTGPYSAGQVLPDVGGVGTGSISDNTVGWSFEFSFKPYGNQTWAKMMDLGDGMGGGSGNWELFFGWHNTDSFYNMGVIFNGQQDYSSAAATTLDDLTPATGALTIGQWYHAVVIIRYDFLQSETTEGSITYDGGIDYAFYQVYLNGVLTGSSNTSLMLPRVQRINANLAKSNYGDAYWQGLIDAFRVYSIALTPAQVSTLYTASISQPPTTGNLTSSSTGMAGNMTSSSSSTGMSGNSTSGNVTSSSSGGGGGGIIPIGGNSTSSSSASNAVSSVSAVSAPTGTNATASGASSSGAASSSGSANNGSTTSTGTSSAAALRSSSSSAATSAPIASSSGTSSVASTAAQTSAPVGVSSATSAQTYVTSATSALSPTTTVTSVATGNTLAPVFITSATSTIAPPVVTVNGAAQSASTVMAVAVAVVAVLAMML